MARMPGAVWRPLASNWASMPRITSWDIFCLHTMVGSLDGTDSYFRQGGYTGTESHFGVGHDGTIYQWQDTAYQADANYRGGWHIISSENADYGTGFPKWNTSDGGAVPAFTDAQIEANAKIAAWLNAEHGIPLDLIPDSKVGRRGIGWHRLGVPGYVVSGGELWSTAAGKVCPGARRIAQIPTISARAKQLVAGGNLSEEDDMNAEQDARLERIEEIVMRGRNGGVQDNHVLGKAILAEVKVLRAAVQALADSAGLDGGDVLTEVRAGVERALADLKITLSADPQG